MGRAAESIAESDRACALDPLALDFGVTNSVVLLWSRRFADAEKKAEHFGRIDSHFWLFAVARGRALEGQGRFADAIAAFQHALTLEGSMPEALMDLGRAQARAGRRADAERSRQELEAFGRRAYAVPFQLAIISAALGQTDRAFEELDRAIDSRSWYVTWLKVDPSLDPLRADPRFAVRLQRVGFAAPR
jgi:tetratricopeptide (TPR) repeat protein